MTTPARFEPGLAISDQPAPTQGRPLMQYLIRFARYDGQTTESRLSGVTFVYGEGFDGAVKIAHAMMAGMRSADPARTYRILKIEEQGARGIDCENGALIWETGEESSARLKAQEKAGL